MKAVIALVLALAAVASAGVLVAHAPVVHAVHTPLVAPAILHTSSSSSYSHRAPAAKIAVAATPVIHHAPLVAHSVPLVHTMSHGVLLH